MDYELSADQRALRSAARDLLEAAAAPERVRKAEGFDADLWREMTAQGWPLLAVPEEHGGLGLGPVEAAVLAEEVGRHVAPAPYLSTALAAHALAVSGAAPQLLERLAEGGVGAVSWGGAPVPDLPVADVAVRVEDERVTAYELGDRRPSASPAMDVTRLVARWADLDGGVELGGRDLAEDLLDRGATAYAAELLGSAERMLETSVAYAGVREQFGRPIGSFQAVKHRCADMYVDVEGMRSSAYFAAWALSVGAPDASLAASTAKSWAGDAGARVLAGALQVHGGIGFTWEHDLHLYLKRVQLSGRLFGSAEWHRERVVRLLAGRVAAGEGLF